MFLLRITKGPVFPLWPSEAFNFFLTSCLYVVAEELDASGEAARVVEPAAGLRLYEFLTQLQYVSVKILAKDYLLKSIIALTA